MLALDSPDGDQGFPGRVRATARYDVAPDGVVVTPRRHDRRPDGREPDEPHLLRARRPGDGDVRDHRLQVAAVGFTPVDAELIPTGEQDVAGTPFDLRTPTLLGDVVAADHPQLVNGLDHNYVLDGAAPQVRLVSPTGDLTLEMTTDQPGLQVYTGQGLEEVAIPDGATGLPGLRRHRPRAPGLPRLAPPPRVALGGPAPGRDLPPRHDLALPHGLSLGSSAAVRRRGRSGR